MPKSWSKNWWPDHAVGWAAFFAAAYLSTFAVNELLLGMVDVLPHHISLVFLPAFVRVVSVVVAGFAGLMGVVIGSLLASLAYTDMPWFAGVLIATASGLGILLAYLVMRLLMNSERLPITLPVLLALTGLYSVFNAVVHGLFWDFLGLLDRVGSHELGLMMLGDFLGVIVMFLIARLFLRRRLAM